MSKNKKILLFASHRDGYSPEQCDCTMTVDEMIDTLKEIKETVGGDVGIYTSNDGGYTYGSLNSNWLALLKESTYGYKVIPADELEGDDYDRFYSTEEFDDEEVDEYDD